MRVRVRPGLCESALACRCPHAWRLMVPASGLSHNYFVLVARQCTGTLKPLKRQSTEAYELDKNFRL